MGPLSCGGGPCGVGADFIGCSFPAAASSDVCCLLAGSAGSGRPGCGLVLAAAEGRIGKEAPIWASMVIESVTLAAAVTGWSWRADPLLLPRKEKLAEWKDNTSKADSPNAITA